MTGAVDDKASAGRAHADSVSFCGRLLRRDRRGRSASVVEHAPRGADTSGTPAGGGDDQLQRDRGLIAIAAGTVAGSTALIGFGLDSVIEVSSAAVVVWQFRAQDPQARERIALRPIAYSFFALAAISPLSRPAP